MKWKMNVECRRRKLNSKKERRMKKITGQIFKFFNDVSTKNQRWKRIKISTNNKPILGSVVLEIYCTKQKTQYMQISNIIDARIDTSIGHPI